MDCARSAAEPVSSEMEADKAHVELLSKALAKFGSYVRASIDEFGRHGDPDSADLATEISRGVDKDLWFVEAHLG